MIGQRGEIGIERREIGLRGLRQQILETVDDEIALLEIIDPIARAHDPPQVETKAIG